MRRKTLYHVLVLACVLITLGVMGNRTVTRQQLEQKLLLDLLVLHKNEARAVDCEALRELLRAKLQEASTTALLEARKSVAKRLLPRSFRGQALEHVIKEDSLIVEGVVREVIFDRESLIQDILNREANPVDVAVTIDVARQFPENPSCGPRFTYHISLPWQRTRSFARDERCIFVFTRDDDGELHRGGLEQRYFIHGDSVTGIADFNDFPGCWSPNWSLSLNEAWCFIEAKHSILTHDGVMPEAMVAEWKRKMFSGDASTSFSYLKLFCKLAPAALSGVETANLVKHHYEEGRSARDRGVELETTFTEFTNLVLLAAAHAKTKDEPEAVDIFYTLYVGDISRNRRSFFRPFYVDDAIVGLVGAVPHPGRIDRLTRLFHETGEGDYEHGRFRYEFVEATRNCIKALEDAPGKDIDTLLLDMNARRDYFRLDDDLDRAFIWRALCRRGVMEIRPQLEAIVRASRSGQEDPGRSVAPRASGF